MVTGLRGYERIKERAFKEGGNINRSGEEGAEGTYKKNLLGKVNCFKKTKRKTSIKRTDGGGGEQEAQIWPHQ